jgi:hypothetical protein
LDLVFAITRDNGRSEINIEMDPGFRRDDERHTDDKRHTDDGR